jgi:hypothetical protein
MPCSSTAGSVVDMGCSYASGPGRAAEWATLPGPSTERRHFSGGVIFPEMICCLRSFSVVGRSPSADGLDVA